MKLDYLKMLFGFGLLAILAWLAEEIAIGKVEEATSHGLMPIVTTLATLGGGFSQWAFGAPFGKAPDVAPKSAAKDADANTLPPA
jgi:hypothetical protein